MNLDIESKVPFPGLQQFVSGTVNLVVPGRRSRISPDGVLECLGIRSACSAQFLSAKNVDTLLS